MLPSAGVEKGSKKKTLLGDRAEEKGDEIA